VLRGGDEALDLGALLFNVFVVAVLVNTGIALYGVVARPNLVKKIIALTILSDSVNTIALIVGYRGWSGSQPPVPPILPTVKPNHTAVSLVASRGVDPLPQALVLTAIVIGLAVTLLLAFITLEVYRATGTVDARRLRGGGV